MTTMMPAALHEHIAAGESQTRDFKASFDKASIESLVAFANAKGDMVLAGVAYSYPLDHKRTARIAQ